jgi:hypothetical protein
LYWSGGDFYGGACSGSSGGGDGYQCAVRVYVD